MKTNGHARIDLYLIFRSYWRSKNE